MLLIRMDRWRSFWSRFGDILAKGEGAFNSRRIERAQQGEKRRIGEAL